MTALLLALAASASAHQLTAEFSDGNNTWTRTMAVEKGKRASDVGPVGAPARNMVVNVHLGLSSKKPDRYRLEYQTELVQKRGSDVVQFVGTVEIRPGTAITVAGCGKWTLSFSLDATGKPSDWEPDDLDNALLSVTRGATKCWRVAHLNAQSSLKEGSSSGGRMKSFSLNDVLESAGSKYVLSYDLQDHSGARDEGTLRLKPGAKTSAGGSSFELQAPQRRQKKPRKSQREQPESGAVRMLR